MLLWRRGIEGTFSGDRGPVHPHDRAIFSRNAMSPRMILAVMLLAVASTTMVMAEGNPSLFLVDGTFQGQWTRIFQVDADSGALQLRADLGTAYTPMLGMAAASGTSLYLTGSDRGPDNLCDGDIACLLIRVELDPLSTTPTLVQVIGTLMVGGVMVPGMTGLTFRNDGRLYAVSQTTGGLYTIDVNTAEATLIGIVDVPVHGGDITFDGSDRLWLWANIGAGSGIYQVDPETAHASVFDLSPGLDLAGMAALGHGESIRGARTSNDRLYEIDTTIGLTGITFPLTLDGAPFDHSRGDLDSPYCEGDEGCADEEVCTTDVCGPGGCNHPPVADGETCNDGDLCTQVDSCQSGSCAGGSPVVCAAPDACHEPGTCDPTSGNCENAPLKPDGTSCDDGNACTQVDSCQSGTCVGAAPAICAAADACHDPGTCNPATGTCEAGTPKPDGTQCDDADACTQVDSCQAGACVGTSPVICTAADACHNPGTCDAATGLCGAGGEVPNGTSCSDGDICTQQDACQAGVCLGGPPSDLDGDGHVDALCGGNDCIDANPFVWLGPFEVTNLSVNPGSSTSVTWDDQNVSAGPGTTFKLASGRTADLQGPGFSRSECLLSAGGNAYTDARPDPLIGEGYWYLARAENSCGIGTFGNSQRDNGIAACP